MGPCAGPCLSEGGETELSYDVMIEVNLSLTPLAGHCGCSSAWGAGHVSSSCVAASGAVVGEQRAASAHRILGELLEEETLAPAWSSSSRKPSLTTHAPVAFPFSDLEPITAVLFVRILCWNSTFHIFFSYKQLMARTCTELPASCICGFINLFIKTLSDSMTARDHVSTGQTKTEELSSLQAASQSSI